MKGYKANAAMDHRRGLYGLSKDKVSISCSCSTNFFGRFANGVEFTFAFNANLKYSSGELIFHKLYAGIEDMSYMNFRFPPGGILTEEHK